MKGFENVKRKLGFGAMRLPMFSETEPDMKQITEMVDCFMERGYNYFDSAFTYLGGHSEEYLGKALVSRYPREDFLLATKSPMFEPTPQSELYKRIDVQRGRYGTDYFDYYLLHNIAGVREKYFRENGAWEFLSDVKEKGIVKHIGFSFHDGPEMLDRLLTEHPEVDFVQLQINYMDWFNETVRSKDNYEVAVKHGKPVIVMEPIKGGSLMGMPKEISDIFKKANPDMSFAQWALRYVISLENVAVVLSGMSTIEQMRENTEFMKDERVLTDDEQKVIDQVREAMGKVPIVGCTACRYCTEVCPVGIKIPELIAGYNDYIRYGEAGGRSAYMMNAVRSGVAPSECLECHACEGNCPQQIEITKYLKEMTRLYGKVK